MDVDVWVRGGAGVNFGVRFLLDGCDDYGETVSARRIEQQEGKATVAGDEAEFRHLLYSSANVGGFLKQAKSRVSVEPVGAGK